MLSHLSLIYDDARLIDIVVGCGIKSHERPLIFLLTNLGTASEILSFILSFILSNLHLISSHMRDLLEGSACDSWNILEYSIT